MKKNYKKNVTAVEKQLVASPAKVYTKRTCTDITLSIAPDNIRQNNREQLRKDLDNIKDGFSWATIAGYKIPYIMRLVNGKHLKFVATRMAEYELLKKYLHNIDPYIYTECTPVKAYVITYSEVKILNYINETYYGKGKDFQYFAGIDYIVHLEDIYNFYLFLEICYKKLLCNDNSGYKNLCGFIRIDSGHICMPYFTQDGQKYVPLFYLTGDIEHLRQRAVKLENWNLAFLKFCLKVHTIKKELFPGDSCLVITIDDVKNVYPPETLFEDFWPDNLGHLYLSETNQKSSMINLPGSWFRKVREVVPDQNTIPHTSTTPVPSTSLELNHMQQQQKQQQKQQIITTPQIQDHNHSNNAAYKIQIATLEGKTIHCINAKPGIYSDWIVTLKELVWVIFPQSCTIAKCAHILHICLKTTLLFGKSEQLAMLQENGLIQSMNPGDTPMAMLKDVTQVLPQLKTFVLMQDKELKQYQSAGGLSK